jgi:PAS domain S-box-containing protein
MCAMLFLRPDRRTTGESQFRQIIESAKHFAIVSTDLAGHVTYWSPGAALLLGWTAAEMMGQTLHRIFTPEDVAQKIPECEQETAKRQGFASNERWHLRKSGERFWATGELTPLKNDADELIGFAKVIRDRTEQKIAESHLESIATQSQQMLATRTRERDRIWRNSLDLLLEIDPAGILRDINPAWTAQLGHEPGDLVGRHFTPFVHPDDVAKTADVISRAAQGPVINFEVRILHKHGGYRDIAWTAAPEKEIIYANGRDVTVERQQAELLKAQHQARIRLAVEAGKMGVWDWDIRTDEVRMLEGTPALHGIESKEIVRFPGMQDYAGLIHPEDRYVLADTVAKAVAKGKDHYFEYRVVHPDGSIHWLEARGTVLLDDEGKPCSMHGVSVDITRRKRAEQNMTFLSQASAELAALVDPASALEKLARLAVPGFADWCAVDVVISEDMLERVAVAHTDPGKVAQAHEFHKLYPPRPDDPNGTWKIIRTAQPIFVPIVTDAMLAESTPDPNRLSRLRDLGLKSYIGVPLIAQGKVYGVVTFVTAESERIYNQEDLDLAIELGQRASIAIENAQLYQAVRKADQDKDVFLATLAHELRNPLAVMSNAVALLGMGEVTPERLSTIRGIMDRQVGQLSRLVDDLLDISRIATGKIALRKEPVILSTVLNHAVEASRPFIEAAHHSLVLDYAEQPAEVIGDVTRLTQVFANLLTNAAKFTNPGGRIEIKLACTPHHCDVRVSDNGIGIEPGALRTIFEIFSQGRQAPERSNGGLGIGLSLVKRLVELHGGSVWASSQGLGKGSEFTVRLPISVMSVAQSRRDQQKENSARGNWWRNKRVLVADDNADAADTLSELLRILGANVRTVYDGQAALETVRREHPDVAVLDIGMPGLNGYDVARTLRADAACSGTLLIALTGWGQERDKSAAAAAGFDHHWIKPVTFDHLQSLADTDAVKSR